jgi:hypothetical protein
MKASLWKPKGKTDDEFRRLVAEDIRSLTPNEISRHLNAVEEAMGLADRKSELETEADDKDWVYTKMKEIVRLVLPDQNPKEPVRIVEEPRAAIVLSAITMALVSVILFASKNREEFKLRQHKACDAIMIDGDRMADVMDLI